MEFSILGPLEVRDGERVLACPSAKQRLLLAVLLLNANEAVSNDRLVEALWGRNPPASARKALQMHVSQLRALLEPGRAPGTDGSTIATRPPGYQLSVEDGQLDLHRFEAAVRQARTARHAGRWGDAAQRLADALSLWRGEALADLSLEEFLQPHVARLEDLRVAAIEDRIDADLALGRHAQLLGELDELVTHHPLRERLRGQFMLALYRAGRQADALAVYARTRKLLVEELGLEPSRELQQLQRSILAQDTALEVDPALVQEARSPAGNDEGLVGRERELAELDGVLERTLAGRGGTVFLAGDAGIGKSRLAEAVAGRGRDRGAAVLVGRCWESGGAPSYWPWVQILRASARHAGDEQLRADLGSGAAEVATILPELRERLPGLAVAAVERPDARFVLFEAVSSYLARNARRRPLVLVFDDLHAADAPSILLLRYVIGQLGEAPVLVLGCYRDAELGIELADGVAEAVREPSVTRLALGGLDIAATGQLLTRALGASVRPELVARVHSQTEGNALYVAEIGRLLAAGGADQPRELPVPTGVNEVIQKRLLRRSARCRRTLEVAAVIGREFPLDVLERVSDLTEPEFAAALDEALAAGLVEEIPGTIGRVRFSHVLVRDVLYRQQPPLTRRALHGAIAQALEALHGANLDPHLAELAHHYRHAPAGSRDKAVGYSASAGHHAVAQLAFEEAVRHYNAALALLEGAGATSAETSCDLLLALGDGLSRSGDGTAAKAAFARAASLAVAGHWPDRLARAAIGYGGRFAWARASTDPTLVPLMEQALLAVGPGDSTERVRLLARLAAALRDDVRRDRRVGMAQEAVAIARRLGDPTVLAGAIEGAQPAVETPSDPAQRIAAADELIALAGQIGDREKLYLGHDLRLNAVWTTCDRDALQGEVGAMVELAEDLGQPAHLWSVRSTQASFALMEGRFAAAESLIEEARLLGERAQSWNAGVSHTLATFVLRRAQGRLDEVAPLCARAAERYTAQWRFQCVLADVQAKTGRCDDARRSLDRLLGRDLAHEHVDAEWLFAMAILAEACAEASDANAAQYVYDALAPFDGLYAEAPVEAPFGCVARALGILAAAAGNAVLAERHLREAIVVEGRMGAAPWQAHAQHDLGSLLLEADDATARELLAEAAASYRRLGMATWADRVAALCGHTW